MGADLLTATIAIPADRTEPLAFDTGRALLREITDVSLFSFNDPESELADLVYTFDLRLHLDTDGQPWLNFAKQVGQEIVDRLEEALDSR